jgi:hypothetical protein
MARSDLQPPTDHHTFILGEPGQEVPMSKTSLILPSHPAATASWLHRRSFLVGAGATGMALGTALGSAYTQIATAPDYSLRIAPLRLELAPREGDRHLWLQWHCTRSGAAPSRRPSGKHRYPQRHRRRRHHTLARSAPALDRRWRHGGGIADGGAWRNAALHVRGESRREPMVPQPRHCRHRSDAELIFRNVRVPDRRTGE